MLNKAKKSALGRGLDALLPKVELQSGIKEVAIESLSVSPFQPRKRLDVDAIGELAQSIAEKGILQPIVVRSKEGLYEIVAGERRFRAAQQLGLKTVPVIVKELNDQEALEIAIIENLQRESLSAVEEARAFKQLMGFGLNQEALAKAVGKSRSAVANALRLLSLSDAALASLDTGEISAGHARAILSQPEDYRDWALAQILGQNLNVRQAEQLIPPALRPKPKMDDVENHFLRLEEDLSRHVGTKVQIRGRDKGKVELHFHSMDELERLLELLGYQP
ncbi:MAG: ParB/RepB/Spo0J family partition protein [Deinococcales bacterium]